MELLLSAPGIALIVYLAFCLFLVRSFKPDYQNMTTANRSVNWFVAGLSITSIFAIITSVLISGGWGYKFGIWGVLAFISPYFVALTSYGYLASKIKENHKDFVTFSDVITRRVGSWTGGVLRTQYTLGTVYSILVNLLSVKIILEVWKVDPSITVVYMALICAGVIAYCWRGGLASSIRTDMVQAVTIVTVAIAMCCLVFFGQPASAVDIALARPGSWDLLINPILLWIFILCSSAFGDMEMMNRTAAIKDAPSVKRAFIFASLLTMLALGMFGLVGMFGAEGLAKADQAVVSVVKEGGFLIQVLFLIAGVGWLTSNLDSSIVAGGTILSHEWWKSRSIKTFRAGMILVAVCGLALASFNINPIEAFIVWSIYRLVSLPSTVAVAHEIKFDDRIWVLAFVLALLVTAGFAFSVFIYKLPVYITIIGYVVGLLISSAGIYIGNRRLT